MLYIQSIMAMIPWFWNVKTQNKTVNHEFLALVLQEKEKGQAIIYTVLIIN